MIRQIVAGAVLLAACATEQAIPERGALWRRAAADGCYDKPPERWSVELSKVDPGRARAVACGRESFYVWRGSDRTWQLVSQ